VEIPDKLSEEEKIKSLEKVLGYSFKNPKLLFQALSHSSYTGESGLPTGESNERLEFLGDSVIELSISHLIYNIFPDYTEGELTKLRAAVVRGKALARAAEELGLGDFLMLGKGEELTGGRRKPSILAGAFEAVIAAVYLDGGFDVAMGIVMSCLERALRDAVRKGLLDYKSDLQEMAMKYTGRPPTYRVTSEGPDHYRTFFASVEVAGEVYGPVSGTSKKEAEQNAAKLAISSLCWKEKDEKR